MTDIYPPKELQRLWGYESHKHPNPELFMRKRIAHWCVQQSQQSQFPATGITDRRPTVEDADKWGRVQWLDHNGQWYCCHWELIATSRDPWLHTRAWEPRSQEVAS